MVCLDYKGDNKDLVGMQITANISQSIAVDINVPLQSINDKNCFEMIDAKYTSGDNVIILIRINAENRTIENNTTKIELGKYVQFPF